MSEQKERLSDEESKAWKEILDKLPKSTYDFLKANPDKSEAWFMGFHDCAKIVHDEFYRIFPERKSVS